MSCGWVNLELNQSHIAEWFWRTNHSEKKSGLSVAKSWKNSIERERIFSRKNERRIPIQSKHNPIKFEFVPVGHAPPSPLDTRICKQYRYFPDMMLFRNAYHVQEHFPDLSSMVIPFFALRVSTFIRRTSWICFIRTIISPCGVAKTCFW